MLPVLFESSFFTLYAYPLFMGLSWGVGFWLADYFFDKYSKEKVNLVKLFLGLFATSWVGAKVFFLFLSSQIEKSKFLYADEFWLGGGFVFYGGLILGLIYFLFYCLKFKKFPIKESHLLLPSLIFGHAIGRVGCFLTGCCYGSQCSYPWSVHMHGADIHPVQLYEATGLVIIGLIIIKKIHKKQIWSKILSWYLFLYSLLRFVLEYYRGDLVRGIHFFQLSSSQLLSLGLLVISLGMFAYLRWNFSQQMRQ